MSKKNSKLDSILRFVDSTGFWLDIEWIQIATHVRFVLTLEVDMFCEIRIWSGSAITGNQKSMLSGKNWKDLSSC